MRKLRSEKLQMTCFEPLRDGAVNRKRKNGGLTEQERRMHTVRSRMDRLDLDCAGPICYCGLQSRQYHMLEDLSTSNYIQTRSTHFTTLRLTFPGGRSS